MVSVIHSALLLCAALPQLDSCHLNRSPLFQRHLVKAQNATLELPSLVKINKYRQWFTASDEDLSHN